ncbi:MAG: ubiquinone biosynthesis regulatory protein kinase UbiB, partial [Pseudomonadota bacterium]
PFIERWMRERIGPKAALNTLRQELPRALALLPELPRLTHEALGAQRRQAELLEAQGRELALLRKELTQARRRGLLIGVLAVTAILLLLGLSVGG